MGENTEIAFSSVVSINPYSNSYVKGISSFLAYDDSVEYSKEQYSISYINTKEFINAHIHVSKNIPDEDLHDAITNKAYDELALDQAVSYKIEYIELYNALDEEERNFNVFVVDPEVLTSRYKNAIDKINYIDTIIPAPLLFKSLYCREIITASGAHAFIYFQKTGAFITVYNEKEFVFSKTLEYSFVQMHEEFCELYGERIEYDEFIDFLTTEDLKNSDSPYKEFFIKLYKELFANVNDILTYVKRVYEINKIDQLYIGTQIHTQSKLDEIAEFELNIKCGLFEFDYGFKSTDEYIDQLHSLMHLHSILPHEQKYICNFTDYKRPPKFINRQSGKLILTTMVALILAFIYPVTYWSLSYAQSLQKELLTKQYNQLHIKKVTTEATIKNRTAVKEKALKLLAQEEKNYVDKKNTLIKIHDVKVNYLMKAKLLFTLTKDLNRYRVGLESLEVNQKEKPNLFILNLVASQGIRITKLIAYMTKVHEGKFNFSLEKIYFDKNEKKYLSQLKVQVL